MSDLERIVEILRAAPSVAVLAHVSPDTDSIGATLGAALALREAGKVTGVYNADPLPPELLSLPGATDLRREVQSGQTYACYLVLDTSNLERTGGLLSGRPAGGSESVSVEQMIIPSRQEQTRSTPGRKSLYTTWL